MSSTYGANISNHNGTFCTLYPDDPYKCDIVITLRKVMASISFIGCIFMFFVMWLFKRYSSFAQKLILYLTIAACMECIAYFMGDVHPDGPMCDFQAFYLTYFDWAVLLWIICLTFNLFRNVVNSKQTSQYHVFYHVLCWGFPIIIASLPFSGDHYGPAGVWCWIEDNWEWRFGIWYGPLFISLALLFVIYGYLMYIIYVRTTRWEGTFDPDVERNKELLKEDIKVIRFYPLIYFAIIIFPLIKRIMDAVDPHNNNYAMLVLSVIAAPLHGAANALLFGLDKETTSRLTWPQIKMAWVTRRSNTEVRAYPDFRRHDESASGEVITPKYCNVTYSRLT